MQKNEEALEAKTWAGAPGCTIKARLGLNEANIYTYIHIFFASTSGGLSGCWNFLSPSQNVVKKGRHRDLSQPGVLGQMTFRSLLAPRTY